MTGIPTDDDQAEVATALHAVLEQRGLTVACAESLTGGELAGALSAAPGASGMFRGGVVAYASDVKVSLLGVAQETVDTDGVISDACAAEMARGVRRLLGADLGLATTGVAGPVEQEGKPVGRVHVAVATADGVHARELSFAGTRAEIRASTVDAVVAWALRLVVGEAG
ncbi:MAG: CinA family protein [Nocardioides sp.]|nr:CinA family protein [Nocardioides sp.]